MPRWQPPAIPRSLLERIVVREPTRSGLLGDLHEEYVHRRRSQGRRKSGLWYWTQTLCAVWRFGPLRRDPSRNRNRDDDMNLIHRGLHTMRGACRSLARTPTLTLASILVPAMAVAANAAVFSLIDAAYLSPLPYAEPERLVRVWNLTPRGQTDSVSPADFIDWKERMTAFADLAVYRAESFNLTDRGDPLRLEGALVSGSLFRMLGTAPLLGRPFSEAWDRPGSEAVAVVGYRLWQGRLGADPAIVGKRIDLNGEPRTVLAVMPADFRFPDAEVDVWAPLALTEEEKRQRKSFYLNAIGRLRPGVDMADADREIKALAARIKEEHPETHGNSAVLTAVRREWAGEAGSAALILQGAVLIVMLAAAANIAHLQLSRMLAKRRDIATRLALGAGNARILMQTLSEALILAAGAAVCGLALARLAMPAISLFFNDRPVWATDIGIDPLVIAATLAASAAAGLISSLLPAFQALKVDPARVLACEGRGSVGGQGYRWRTALASAQVAMALILMVGAGLLGRSLYHMTRLELGFEPDRVLTMRMDLPEEKYPLGARRSQFYDQVLAQVEGLPDVESAGFTAGLPFTLNGGALGFTAEGLTRPDDGPIYAVYRGVSADYLQCLRVPLAAGRYFEPGDFSPGRAAVVVNQAMAQRFWPGEDPVGRRLKLFGENSSQPWAMIVGVVKTVRRFDLAADPPPAFYAPYSQVPIAHFTPRDLVVRTRIGASATLLGVREAIRRVDPSLPLYDIRSLSSLVREASGDTRSRLALLSVFGVLSCLIAALGVYGVVAFAVRTRLPEFGLRLALGAGPGRISRIVLRQGSLIVVAGFLVGIPGAFLLTRYIASWLHGVAATDPWSYAAACALLAAVVILSALGPARRAARADAADTLRG